MHGLMALVSCLTVLNRERWTLSTGLHSNLPGSQRHGRILILVSMWFLYSFISVVACGGGGNPPLLSPPASTGWSRSQIGITLEVTKAPLQGTWELESILGSGMGYVT